MPYIGQQNTGNSKIKKSRFTATASQVDFSVASNAGDELQVFLNGVLLKETDDYTHTTSTVSLGTGATVSDIVEVHVYQSFVVADAVRGTGDTMSGELEVPTVKLSSNIIKASDGGSTITLDTSDNVTIAGNVKVGGNIIQASDGGNTLTLDTSDNLTVAGNIQVGGNVIKASDGGSTITLDNSDNVTLAGNLVIPDSGNIGSASDTDAISIASDGGVTFSGGIDNAGTISAGTIGGAVNFPSIGQLVFFGGYKSNNSTTTYTMDGSSTYAVIVNGRISSTPYFPVNLTFSINSSDGNISNKTDSWGNRLDESFNNTTKVLTITNHNSTDLMSILIFRYP